MDISSYQAHIPKGFKLATNEQKMVRLIHKRRGAGPVIKLSSGGIAGECDQQASG
jgi:hypothetical protein